MAFELRDNSGSLFKNGKREKDSQPNARGDCKIDGIVYEISAWTKKDKNGNPWQSLSFKVKNGPPAQHAPSRSKNDNDDDPIPF